MTLKRWLRIHRYLGLFAAPLVVTLAVSGAWQAFDLHRSWKDGSYRPPAPVAAVSELHMSKRAGQPAGAAFRGLVALVALSLVANAGIGVAVAFRLAEDRRWVWFSLCAGTLLPLAAYVIGRP